MDSQLFKSSKLKIERAKKHTSELNNEIVSFLRRKPYRIVIEPGAEPGIHSLVIRVRENIPDNFPTIIGDAIHNLRAALDLLACDLVRMNDEEIEDVYFPFCKDGKDFENTIHHRHLDRAAPEIVDIIRSLKPYNGGDDTLRAIHDLDISDKHKLLIPCSYYCGIPSISINSVGGGGLEMINCRFGPIQDGQSIVTMPAKQNLKLGQSFIPTIHITFGEGPLGDQPIVSTLYQLTQLVDGIVRRFEAHLINKQ